MPTTKKSKEAGAEGVVSTTPVSKRGNSGRDKKSGGGRQEGAVNYKDDLLLTIISEIKPRGGEGWKMVAERYQGAAEESKIRDEIKIKEHFIKKMCMNGKKPTGQAGDPKKDKILRAQKVYNKILKESSCKTVGGFSDDEDDEDNSSDFDDGDSTEDDDDDFMSKEVESNDEEERTQSEVEENEEDSVGKKLDGGKDGDVSEHEMEARKSEIDEVEPKKKKQKKAMKEDRKSKNSRPTGSKRGNIGAALSQLIDLTKQDIENRGKLMRGGFSASSTHTEEKAPKWAEELLREVRDVKKQVAEHSSILSGTSSSITFAALMGSEEGKLIELA